MTKSTSELTPTFITIEELKSERITVTDHYQLTWENCLLITRYGEEQTFVLLTNGQRLVIDQPLHETITDFSHLNDCFTRCLEPYYGLLAEKVTIKALVAGHNSLVPSMGLKNPAVVHYQTSRLKAHSYSKEKQAMLLHFEVKEHCYYVWVPAYEKKFDKILRQADQVSHYQLIEMRDRTIRYGISENNSPIGNHYYEQAEIRQIAKMVKDARYRWFCNQLHLKAYGEPLNDEHWKHIKCVISECVKRAKSPK